MLAVEFILVFLGGFKRVCGGVLVEGDLIQRFGFAVAAFPVFTQDIARHPMKIAVGVGGMNFNPFGHFANNPLDGLIGMFLKVGATLPFKKLRPVRLERV